MLGRAAFAAEPLKVGLIYLGPIGDFGWTWAHEKGRKAMVDALKGQVVADYVENVKEDASAVPILKDLAQSGHQAHLRDVVRLHGPMRRRRQAIPERQVRALHRIQARRQPRHLQLAFPSGPGGRGYDRRSHVEVGGDRLSRLLQGSRGRARRELLYARCASAEPEDHNQTGDDQLVVRPGQGSRGGADARQPRLRRHRPAHRQPRGTAGLRAAQSVVLRPRRRHVALRAEDPA